MKQPRKTVTRGYTDKEIISDLIDAKKAGQQFDYAEQFMNFCGYKGSDRDTTITNKTRGQSKTMFFGRLRLVEKQNKIDFPLRDVILNLGKTNIPPTSFRNQTKVNVIKPKNVAPKTRAPRFETFLKSVLTGKNVYQMIEVKEKFNVIFDEYYDKEMMDIEYRKEG